LRSGDWAEKIVRRRRPPSRIPRTFAQGPALNEAKKVPATHAALLDIFKGISNTFDAEAYARLLSDEEARAEFYRRLSEYSRTFTVALASPA
jgi:hypothetical protein